MVRTIVCDLDGSLMNPSSGIYVNEAVKEALIEVEKKNVLVILNSARCFQGVYPLSKQILMQDFGGYVISCNGAHCFDVKMKKTMFEYVISNNDVSFIWQYAQKHNLGVGYSQSDYFVANKMTHGFELDMHNCDVDYILTNHMEKYLKGSVWKVSISDSKSRIDSIYDEMKSIIELNCNVKVVHSTDTMIDIIHKDCEKLNSVNRLLKNLEISWKDVSSIGDGSSDAPVLEASGLGVTLEMAVKHVKKSQKNCSFML